MEKKTILLYYPLLEKSILTKPRCLPMQLLAIAAPLLKEGYDVQIFDALIDPNVQEKILKKLDDAICLGITVLTGYSIVDCLKLSKKIKEVNPSLPVVWGGWHPSILPIQTIKDPHVDIIVRGQGEVTFLELVKCLEKKAPFKKVLGITYKHKGKIFTNPDRPRTPLNDLPPVPFHIIDIEKYINKEVGERTLGYVSSQGCPYNCAFCADALVYKRIRMELSAERVIKDLKYLIETYNIDGFLFEDSNFFVDKEKVKKICKAIIENKWNIKWVAFERTDHFLKFDEETIKLIKDGGCCLLVVGAESGSQRILDFLNKGIKVEDTIKFTKLCKKYGIGIRYDFMIGLPNEKPADFQKTINLMRDVYKINKTNILVTQFYTPYPGTPLYDKVVKEYDFKPPQSLVEWSKYDRITRGMNWVNKEYKERLNTFLFYLQFAFTNEHFEKKIENLKKFKSLVWLMNKIALLRFKINFFKFPIEKKIYIFLRKYFI